MAQPQYRVRVEELDWAALMPWVRLFRSFRMAVHPPKLLLALLLVVLVFMGGRLLDAVWGPRAYAHEIKAYTLLPAGEYHAWRASQAQEVRTALTTLLRPIAQEETANIVAGSDRFAAARAMVNAHTGLSQERRRQVLQRIDELEPRGIFDTALAFQIDAFGRLVRASTALRFGFGGVLRGSPHDPTTAAGALYDMAVVMPGWMLRTHPWFTLFFAAGALLVWAVLGGGIARMAATEATRGQAVSPIAALRFSFTRAGWFILTPLLPLMLAGVIYLLLLVGGFAFFNLPVLDILGGLVFILALLGGLMILMLLILLATGGHLFYPALAVEGADSFDAVSRAFGYLLNRPWQWLFYNVAALVYGAITYLFIGGLVFLTLLITQRSVRGGVVRETDEGLNRFETILPTPEFGRLAYQIDWSQTAVPFTAKIASGLIWVWVFLLVGLLAAFAISFYFSAQTWIYLLLRRATDGTEYDDVYVEPEAAAPGESPTQPAAEPAAVPEKVEP